MLRQRRQIAFLHRIYLVIFFLWLLTVCVYSISLFAEVNTNIENTVFTYLLILAIMNILLFVFNLTYSIILMLIDKVPIITEVVIPIILSLIVFVITTLLAFTNTVYQKGFKL